MNDISANSLLDFPRLSRMLANALDDVAPIETRVWVAGDLLDLTHRSEGSLVYHSRGLNNGGLKGGAGCNLRSVSHSMPRYERLGTQFGQVPYLLRKTIEYPFPTRITSVLTDTVAVGAAGTKASLDLAPITTNCETVVRTKIADRYGNSVTLAFVADGAGAGTLTESAYPAIVFHFQTAVTTVANFETAIGASTYLEVQTVDAVGVLAVTVDEFGATALTSGAGAQRYNTAAKTITISETAERVFESVRLVVKWRDDNATDIGDIGWLIGIQGGSGPTEDYIRDSVASAKTIDHKHDVLDMECTDYFRRWFGTGATQDFVASFKVATDAASSINGITIKLVITYAFAPSNNTRMKTIRIPIQSQITVLTTSQQEIGTDGTNPAPANQIPALDTFLPEITKAYKSVVMEIEANDSNTSGTGTITPSYQIDSDSEVAMAPIVQTQSTVMRFEGHADLNAMTTNAAHAFKMKSSVNVRIVYVSALLIVTYSYDHAATLSNNSAIYEAIVPLTALNNDDHPGQAAGMGVVINGTTQDLECAYRYVATLDIQETSPVLVQSGLVLRNVSTGSAVAWLLRAGSQVSRTYTNSATVGESPMIHRVDHGAGAWTLARGRNRLTADAVIPSSVLRGSITGYALINYTAAVRVDVDRGNHAINYHTKSYESATSTSTKVTEQEQGNLEIHLGTPYKISGVMIDQYVRSISAIRPLMMVDTNQGEYENTGFIFTGISYNASPTEMFSAHHTHSLARAFNADNLHTGRMDIETRRNQFSVNAQASIMASWNWWVTYHQHTFESSATVEVDGVAAAAGKTVQVYAVNTSLVDTSASVELVTTATVGAAGAFSFAVPDDTRSYFVSYVDGSVVGRSINGTPGSSDFSMEIFTTGGGGGGGGGSTLIGALV